MDRGVPPIPGTLVSDEVANYLKTKVSQVLHTRFNVFPGSQPVSFTRDHLTNNLMNRDYLVCEKSDGLRLLLFVLINQDTEEEGTFLINRENEYYMVSGFHFPRTKTDFDSSHNGTIVDGELVWSTNPTTGVKEMRFLIFDCLALDMESVMHKNLLKRLYHAQHDFFNPFMELRRNFPDAVFPFKIAFKNMTQPYKIRRIFQEMKHLTYVSDGLILTCCDTPYIPGTDSTLLKWKPAEENTIDLKLGLNFPIYIDEELPAHDPNREYPNYDAKPEFKLYVWKGGDDPNGDEDIETNIKRNGGEYKNSFRTYEEWNILDVDDKQWDEMKSSGESFNGRITEVRRDPDGKWRMLRFRDDKVNGNFIGVVLKVLKSIEDAVKKEELINAENEIKSHWIEREKRRQGSAKRQLDQPQHHQPPPPPQQQQQQQHKLKTQSQPYNDEIPKYTSIAEPTPPPAPAPAEASDDDEYYESDGFEELPTYAAQTNSPKYGEMDGGDSKRRKL